MQELLRLFCALICWLGMTACSPEDADKVSSEPVSLMIRDVTVIDPESETSRKHQTVVIDGNRIIAITPVNDDRAYTPATIIDGNGKYLVPGLMDMHVHVAHPMFSDTTLKLLLANGVTGVREMSGDCWEPRGEIFACIDAYRELQATLETGETFGPRILRLSSAIVRGPAERHPPHVPDGAADFVTPHNADEARRLVRFLDERGVDFIKTYTWLMPETYFALLDEAGNRDMEVSGHVPMPVSIADAVSRGHRTIEHAKTLPYECSNYLPEMRRDERELFDTSSDAVWPGDAEIQQHSMAQFNADRCKEVMQVLVENDAWYVPTHETREMDARASEPDYRNDPRLAFISAQMKGFWQRDLENTASKSPEAIASHREFFDYGLRITRFAHDAGVNIMAGTDANDTMSFPGFSLHDELAHLANAGLEPMEVLRTATTIPARYLGRENELGGIARGKLADLVLLAANPLQDIRNTARIESVIINGRVHDRAALDTVLDDVRQQAGTNPRDNTRTVEVPANVLADYAGTYTVPSSNLVITVTATATGIQASAPGMPVIDFFPETRTMFFMQEDDTKFEFVVDADNTVKGLEVIWTGGRSEFAPRTQ